MGIHADPDPGQTFKSQKVGQFPCSCNRIHNPNTDPGTRTAK
jgi:hypothetical protein